MYAKEELYGRDAGTKQYRYDCEAKLVGQPAIKSPSWFMIDPTTMNAFYDYESNSINIVPGFVTSLLYADDTLEEDLLGGVKQQDQRQGAGHRCHA